MMARVREDGVEVGDVEEMDPVEHWWHPLPSLPVGPQPADQQGATSQLLLGDDDGGGAKKLVARKQGELQMEVTQSQMWSWSCPLEW